MSLPCPLSVLILLQRAVAMSGGSPTRWRSGVHATPDSLTLQPEVAFDSPLPHSSPDGHADIATSLGVSIPGASGEPHSGIPTAHSHQQTIPDHVLHNPEQLDDAPYVPPRITHAELQAYPALDPRVASIYDSPNHDIRNQPFPYDGATSPSESHNSVESSWSNSSSSSATSQRFHLEEPIFSHASLQPRHTTYQGHYPAYHGHHRLGLEHLRYGEHTSNTGGSYYRTPPQGLSIDGLLSPEIFEDTAPQVALPSQVSYSTPSIRGSSSSSCSVSATNHPQDAATFSASSAPLTDGTSTLAVDAGSYLRQQLGLAPHEVVSLNSLPDPPPGEKPSTPLPMLIKLAIYGSPNRQLTLQEIYTALENRFQWFQEHKNNKAWKNSIRHNLSLNKVFINVPRPITEPGKGSYWQLDVSGGEGYKRTRKRRPKNKMIVSEEEDDEASEVDENLPGPADSSQHAGTSRSADAQIDPELRSEGHIVGENRARSTARRAGRESPYPSHSPRYQQGLPVAEQDAAPGQPSVRFGQSSFPTFSQIQSIPITSSSSLFAAMSSSPMTMAPTTVVRPQSQHAASDDRTAHVPQFSPRPGIEYVVGPGGLPAARRVSEHPNTRAQPQENPARSSPDSSSSGSSRTWNNARSRC